MKKIASVAVMAVLALGFTSCKKDYTCTCKTSQGTSVAIPYGKTKKSAAKDACEASNTIYKGQGGSCSL